MTVFVQMRKHSVPRCGFVSFLVQFRLSIDGISFCYRAHQFEIVRKVEMSFAIVMIDDPLSWV